MSLQHPHILIAESLNFSPRAAALLRKAGDVVMADVNYEGLLSGIRTADVLWVRLRNQIDKVVLTAAPSLKFIATPTTGLNHIDLDEAHRRGIDVLSLKGEGEFLKDVRATAELTVASILDLLRHLPRARASVLQGTWDRDPFRGHELYGMTAGIVGFGRLGRIVSHYLRAFDMTVLATDPHVSSDEVPPDVRLVSMERLLQESDVVTIHVDLSAATRGFFGQQQFAMMKNGSWFINTSRGELVDEVALIHALETEHLSGAALDVVSDERGEGMAAHPLIQFARGHDTLLITPHIGGNTWESAEKTEYFLAQKVVSRLRAARTSLEGGVQFMAFCAFSAISAFTEYCC